MLDINPTSLDGVCGLIQRRGCWPAGRRPHGVLVLIADHIEDNIVVSASGPQLPIEGLVGVFGPRRGRVRYGPFVVAKHCAD